MCRTVACMFCYFSTDTLKRLICLSCFERLLVCADGRLRVTKWCLSFELLGQHLVSDASVTQGKFDLVEVFFSFSFFIVAWISWKVKLLRGEQIKSYIGCIFGVFLYILVYFGSVQVWSLISLILTEAGCAVKKQNKISPLNLWTIWKKVRMNNSMKMKVTNVGECYAIIFYCEII